MSNLNDYKHIFKKAQREHYIIELFKSKASNKDDIKSMDDINNQYYDFTLNNERIVDKIKEIKTDKTDMIIVLHDKKDIRFKGVKSLRKLTYEEKMKSTIIVRNNTDKIEWNAINGEFSNNAYSTHLKNIIERCINNSEFKKCFKEEYGKNNALHELDEELYKNAINSFGDIETMDENLKRNLASAIRIMADKFPEGIKTKESLKELANKYYTPLFKGRFGGSRRKTRKALRKKTYRKKTHRKK